MADNERATFGISLQPNQLAEPPDIEKKIIVSGNPKIPSKLVRSCDRTEEHQSVQSVANSENENV
jgi:hypothetical protein